MLNKMREAVIASVRLRASQGDCPTEPAHSTETLESVILDLAGAAPLRVDARPANVGSLERSIAELDAFERGGMMLCEVENEVSFTESLALCLHELKRLRALTARQDAATDAGVERPSDKDLEPHLPETVRSEKRCGIQRSAWLTGWFVPWSPRNDNENAEGPWSHWVALAENILAADAKARAALTTPKPDADDDEPIGECSHGVSLMMLCPLCPTGARAQRTKPDASQGEPLATQENNHAG